MFLLLKLAQQIKKDSKEPNFFAPCRAEPQGTGVENELALGGNLETPSGHSSNSWL